METQSNLHRIYVLPLDTVFRKQQKTRIRDTSVLSSEGEPLSVQHNDMSGIERSVSNRGQRTITCLQAEGN
jgi:hypothetical protein